MTVPLKIPAPAPLPRDLSVGHEPGVARVRRIPSYEAEDEATLLWRAGDRTVSRGFGFEATEVKPFPFEVAGDESDATLITKPNLADPRLLRSDRPPALKALSSSQPASAKRAVAQPASAPPARPAVLALLAPAAAPSSAPVAKPASIAAPSRPSPVPRRVLAEPIAETLQDANTPPPVPAKHLVASTRPAAPSDWDESVIAFQKPRRRALRVVAVGLLAAAVAAIIVMHPEESASLVDRVVAGGSALAASLR